jgi:hypothetical protein
VNLSEIAHTAGTSVDDLHACCRGELRLSPAVQMQLAASVLSCAPQHARLAHALFGQAQAALRFEAGDVVRHTTYPGPSHNAGSSSTTRLDGSLRHRDDLFRRSLAAHERAEELCLRRSELMEAASVLAKEHAELRETAAAALQTEVTRFAHALRESGEVPERALVLVKDAVASVFSNAGAEQTGVMADVVRWFVDAYYAA